MKKYKKTTVERVQLVIDSPALGKVVSSLQSSLVLGIITLRLPVILLDRNIVTISNKSQTMVKSTPGEFPASILRPKRKARSTYPTLSTQAKVQKMLKSGSN